MLEDINELRARIDNNPSTWEAEKADLFESEAWLVYKASHRTANAITHPETLS